MEANDGFISGGISGASAGAGIGFAVGGPVGAGWGAAAGFIAGGLLGSSQQKQQEQAQKKAQQQAERLRVQQVLREFGRKQQADSMLLTGLARNNSANASRSQVGVTTPPPGAIGSGIGSAASGTF